MSGIHVFDHHVEVANRWVKEVGARLGLPSSDDHHAAQALRAGLHALRDRLPAGEVLDLSAQLPTLIRGIFFDGWKLSSDPTEIRTRVELVQRVEEKLPPVTQLDGIDVIRAVIAVLHAHVTAGELGDIASTFPASIAELWNDVARAESLAETHRTGYSR